MLMILGVTAIVAGALLTVTAGLLFRSPTQSVRARRLLGGQAVGVLLATLMGLGVVFLFAFLVTGKPGETFAVETAIAAAIAVAGLFAVRRAARKAAATGTPPALGSADGRRKRAA